MSQMEIETNIRSLTILCAMCGLNFTPSANKTTLCTKCIANTQDITLGVTKEAVLNFCRFCKRYLRPPWIACSRESKDLLALCLKKIKGMQKMKIVDAVFIYTDPSTKKIKIKITIQKDFDANTSLQRTFIVEFLEHYQQCDECKQEFTPHTWSAQVQIRQKTEHKKTFFFLEQALLKHNANDKVLKVEEQDEGLDFFFKNRTHSKRLIDFLTEILPITCTSSKQLISHDANSNTFNYKYVESVEIPRMCKDDLVVIPQKLAKELGGVNRVLLCTKISTLFHLLDVKQMKAIELSLEQWKLYETDIELHSLRNQGTEMVVLDIELPSTAEKDQQKIVKGRKAILKYGNVTLLTHPKNEQIIVKSHLATTLRVGQTVKVFDLSVMNLELGEKYEDQVVIVKKVCENTGNKRIFKLKRLENEMEVEVVKKKDNKKKEQEYEDFLDDVQQNKDLREHINLYKNPLADPNAEDDDIKLADLMNDLVLTDPVEKEKEKKDENNEENIEDFIKKLDKVRIEY